jgi:hypothetical protein
MQRNHLFAVIIGLSLGAACGQLELGSAPQPAGSRRDLISNESCTSAQPITVGQTLAGTTLGATNDLSCGFNFPGGDAVYAFTPTAAGAFSVRLSAPGDAGYMPLYPYLTQGFCDGGCVAGPNQTTPSMNFRASAATPYFIVVDSTSPFTSADFSISLLSITPPGNDTCSNPTSLSLGVPVPLDFSNAFDDYQSSFGFDAGVSNCGSYASSYANPDLVYRFTAPSTGRFQFSSSSPLWVSQGVCGSN